MSSTSIEKTRLDFRLTREAKELIEKAAVASNQSLTDYAISALISISEKIIERERTTHLSEKDAEVFLKLLDTAAHPNVVLRQAARRYKKSARNAK